MRYALLTAIYEQTRDWTDPVDDGPEEPPANCPDVIPLELQAIPEQGLESAFGPRNSRLDRNEFPESEMCGF